MGLIPLPYRLLLLGALLAAGAASGYRSGAAHVQAKFNTYQAAVEAAGKAQTEKTEAAIQTQKTLTAQTETDYAKSATALRTLYGPGRVRHNNTRRRPVPAVPGAAVIADAAPADSFTDPDGFAAQNPRCLPLERDAAMTTLQLLHLQAWVAGQGEVK